MDTHDWNKSNWKEYELSQISEMLSSEVFRGGRIDIGEGDEAKSYYVSAGGEFVCHTEWDNKFATGDEAIMKLLRRKNVKEMIQPKKHIGATNKEMSENLKPSYKRLLALNEVLSVEIHQYAKEHPELDYDAVSDIAFNKVMAQIEKEKDDEKKKNLSSTLSDMINDDNNYGTGISQKNDSDRSKDEDVPSY